MPVAMHADVALVVDSSTSMLEEVRAGVRRRDAATEAAVRFINKIGPLDQVTVVWFNESAGVALPLTSDKTALIRALNRLENSQYTRIDLGIMEARLELTSERRHSANRPIMVVLTDGKSNPVPISAAEEESRLSKTAGITIFTLGLGPSDELDHGALGRIASRIDYYYQTPDAEDLGAIYDEIAGVIPCPPDRFWGRRSFQSPMRSRVRELTRDHL